MTPYDPPARKTQILKVVPNLADGDVYQESELVHCDGATFYFMPERWASLVRARLIHARGLEGSFVPTWDGRPQELYTDGYQCTRCWFEWSSSTSKGAKGLHTPVNAEGLVVCAMCEPDGIVKAEPGSGLTFLISVYECRGADHRRVDHQLVDTLALADSTGVTIAEAVVESVAALRMSGWIDQRTCVSVDVEGMDFASAEQRDQHRWLMDELALTAVEQLASIFRLGADRVVRHGR